MISSTDAFFDVPKTTRTLSDGSTMELPILYIDSSNLAAWFQADLHLAQSLLPAPLTAIPSESGRAMVYVGVYEYRETSIGAYNEVGVGIQCIHPDNPAPGMYVIDLPVTTEIARLGGVEIFGYPKFVADIPVRFEGSQVSCEVVDEDGKRIMFLSGDRGTSLPSPPMDLLTFANEKTDPSGNPNDALVHFRNPFHASNGSGLLLRIGDSNHRMANNLRILKLDCATPLFAMFTSEFQSTLGIAE